MNNFIKTLDSIGGVKPCPNEACHHGEMEDEIGPVECRECHGTGQILDLNPLLAKPSILATQVTTVLQKWDEVRQCPVNAGSIIVIGPQRASNLVYEVARQLGGTAISAILVPSSHGYDEDNCSSTSKAYYKPSLPIPENSTVLFVTDSISERGYEIHQVVDMVRSWLVNKKHTLIPYVLALTSAYEKFELHPEEIQWPIISLHQEKNNG